MEHLKKLRKKRGVSQQVVADYLEITRQAYSNYENGNRAPDNETLLKLGEFFGVSLETLLRGSKNIPIAINDDEDSDGAKHRLYSFIDSATDEERQKLIEYSKFIESQREK